MQLAQLTSTEDGAVYASEILLALAEKLGVYAISVDVDQDMHMLCRHPITKELAYFSIEELIEADGPVTNNTETDGNVVTFNKRKSKTND